MNFDPASHAEAGHTIEITSVPMYCVTCDIYLTNNDDNFSDDDSTPITDK